MPLFPPFIYHIHSVCSGQSPIYAIVGLCALVLVLVPIYPALYTLVHKKEGMTQSVLGVRYFSLSSLYFSLVDTCTTKDRFKSARKVEWYAI